MTTLTVDSSRAPTFAPSDLELSHEPANADALPMQTEAEKIAALVEAVRSGHIDLQSVISEQAIEQEVLPSENSMVAEPASAATEQAAVEQAAAKIVADESPVIRDDANLGDAPDLNMFADTAETAIVPVAPAEAGLAASSNDAARFSMQGDPMSIVQAVMRESYTQTTLDLYAYAEKVYFYNDVKKALRDELGRANTEMASIAGKDPDSPLAQPFQTRDVTTEYAGQPFEQLAPVEVGEVKPKGPLEIAADAVMELLPEVLPLVIATHFPAAKNLPGAIDEIVDTVMGLAHGIRSGATPQELLHTVVEGVYDMLPIVIPALVVGKLGPQSAGIASAITNIVMGLIPNPHAEEEDDGQLETKAELEAYIKKLEDDLSSVGDDAQLANVDLQNVLQKQQQNLQLMSNASKTAHDSAMAVTRNIAS